MAVIAEHKALMDGRLWAVSRVFPLDSYIVHSKQHYALKANTQHSRIFANMLNPSPGFGGDAVVYPNDQKKYEENGAISVKVISLNAEATPVITFNRYLLNNMINDYLLFNVLDGVPVSHVVILVAKYPSKGLVNISVPMPITKFIDLNAALYKKAEQEYARPLFLGSVEGYFNSWVNITKDHSHFTKNNDGGFTSFYLFRHPSEFDTDSDKSAFYSRMFPNGQRYDLSKANNDVAHFVTTNPSLVASKLCPIQNENGDSSLVLESLGYEKFDDVATRFLAESTDLWNSEQVFKWLTTNYPNISLTPAYPPYGGRSLLNLRKRMLYKCPQKTL